jgi:hypothetical protein
VLLDLFTDGFHVRVRAKEVHQRLVLAQQRQQQMFGLDKRTADSLASYRPKKIVRRAFSV